MPFSKLHIAGNVMIAIGGAITYSCAFKGNWKLALLGVGFGTLGGVAILMAPSLFQKAATDEPVSWTYCGDRR